MDIERLLADRSKRINAVIERWIPRTYTAENLIQTLGPARYHHDPRPANAAIASPLWDLLDRGGKRWRPLLFSLICDALGGDSVRHEDLAVIVEVVHNGSLVHDDVEDNSDLRRGKPALHKIYGIDVAVNAGSAMYYLPLLVLLKNKDRYTQPLLLKLYEAYSQELINIHFGQAMDIAWHRGEAGANDITEDVYLQMCAYKTGTLARLAARLGAIVAGASEPVAEQMGALAEAIGIGFQIQDDILNLTATSGKNQFTTDYLGSDISEGKRTLMVIHALRHAAPSERARLLETLASHTTDRARIQDAIAILQRAGSIEYAKQRARAMAHDAWNNARPLLKKTPATLELEAFVAFLVEREY